MNEQETAAVATGAEAVSEKIKELTERFDALVAKLKLSQETHDEERAVRLLAWKIEWDMMMRERNAAIDAHLAQSAANAAVTEQARVMVATRHEEAGEMSLHREAMERIYREGFADITNALKALTTPTIIANESGIGK